MYVIRNPSTTFVWFEHFVGVFRVLFWCSTYPCYLHSVRFSCYHSFHRKLAAAGVDRHINYQARFFFLSVFENNVRSDGSKFFIFIISPIIIIIILIMFDVDVIHDYIIVIITIITVTIFKTAWFVLD